jgi:hypothetical protein
LTQNEKKRRNKDADHDQQIDHELDRYGVKLIKVIGVFGVALGIIVLIAFWYWVIRYFYNAS